MTIHRSPLHRRAVTMLVIATGLWGLSFPLMKAMGQVVADTTPGVGSLFVTASMVTPRFALAALVIVALLGRGVRTITRAEWQQGSLLGVFAGGGMLFQADGLQFTAASTSAFLSQFYAILIPLYLAVRTRRSPGAWVWLCTGLVLVGVAIMGRFNWRELHLGRGEVETLVASVFFTGQILVLARRDFVGNRVLPITLAMFLTEALIMGVVWITTTPSLATLAAPLAVPAWWGFTLALTVCCTLGAFLLMNTWQPHISSTEAGLIYCVEPIFSALLSMVLPGLFSIWAAIHYPNESLTSHLLIGGGIITLANVLLQLKPPRPEQDPTAITG